MTPEYTFAFQPIVDMTTRAVVAYEALARGINEEQAVQVLAGLSGGPLHLFDIEARRKAINLAATLGIDCALNLNLLPRSVDEFGEIAMADTVEKAAEHGIPLKRIMLEVTETETIANYARFVKWAHQGRALGVKFAIDDFGSGYSGLNLLAEFQPDAIKLDMMLVRDISTRGPRQAIVRGIIRTCDDLGIDIVAEGVETLDEYEWLLGEGINLFQGYLFAQPAFQALPKVNFPDF